jgi:GAF domain-containing protein
MLYPALCQLAIDYEGQVYGVPEAINLPAQMTHGLYIGGEIKGRIYLAYTEKHDFLNEESALLGGMATRLSNYLENRRLFEQIQMRIRREQLLREVTTRIRDAVDVDTVMRTVAREVGQALGRPAFIYLGQNPDTPETPPSAEKEEA